MASGVALGTFDGLHIGHMKVLENVKKYGEGNIRPVVLLFDVHPLEFLTGVCPTKLISDSKREQLLKQAGFDTYTLKFSKIYNLSPREFVKKILVGTLGAELVSCGFNFRFGSENSGDTAVLKKICSEYGIKTVVAGELDYKGEPVSSTRIREEIKNGSIKEANKMLGRLFSYSAEVVTGDKRGREMGFPTINQFFEENFTVPKKGVYASVANVNGIMYASMTDIGVRPTAGISSERSETNIFGYSGNLYSEKIEVSLIDYIRPEIKFASFDDLIMQETKDRDKCMVISGEYLKSNGEK